ncbi:hypothetical protein JCM8208_004334 [Rhodotorula glutinis]
MPADERPLAPFEEEHASLARRRAAPARARRSSPLRICVGLLALAGLALCAFIAYFTVQVLRQVHDQLAHPHKAHHVDPAVLVGDSAALHALEPDVVRSFYGRDVGSVDSFNLKAAIWLRTTDKLKDPDAPWEKVYEDVVLRDVKIGARAVHARPRVRLSKEHLDRMRMPHTRLQSTYVMLPSSSRLESSIDYHTFRTSRNTSMHSIDGPLPPVNVDDSDVPQKGVFRDFLGNSACFSQLFDSSPSPDDHVQANSTGPAIETKTYVSLIDDYPQKSCYYGGFGSSACVRSFDQDGHFETLIEFDNARDGDKATASQMGWRYSPFITTRFGYRGPLDRVELPQKGSAAEEDFSFDWHISWAPVSSLKLAVGGVVGNGLAPAASSNASAYERAQAQDFADIFHSSLGHSVLDDARPGLRAFLRLVQTIVAFTLVPLHLSYWATRALATGISLPLAVLNDSWSVVAGLVSQLLRNVTHDGIWVGWLIGAGESLDLVFKSALLLRLEFTWAGPFSLVPTSMTRRRVSHSERASSREDLHFGWTARILAVAVITVIYRSGPSLPHLVAASPPSIDMVKTHEASQLWKLLHPWVAGVSSALSVVSEVGQIHLNYRRGTFAGMYRMAAVLRFAFEVLEALPILFLRIFGEWHLRPPFRFEDVVSIAISAIVAGQAFQYPAVTQVEEEEE